MNFLSLLPLLTSAFSPTLNADEPPFRQCQQESDAKVRLACYDALARYRKAEDGSRQEHEYRLQTDPLDGDLTLVRQLDTATTFSVSCLNTITHLRINFTLPWEGQHVNTSVDGLPFEGDWFVRDRGKLLEFGRGLPAINALKRWSQSQEVILTSDSGRKVRIPLTGFGEALKPLRQQCRW
ncbi:hypothetical protein LG71_07915 [Pluralibacter gergoviae]|uniref:type VI secretion system-associated protein TagO n=1 Tax=Pluralibacter gergoviae TaxID=61647 RepID=UPI0004F729FB|nr:type VI secretion system-associated protein TagO [Pluralibacter gergoviae]AIQ99823.1 hypothetical protein LG71_07915 [Pluralibacter gergoviae]